jgi:hypothetical protein
MCLYVIQTYFGLGMQGWNMNASSHGRDYQPSGKNGKFR